MAVKEGKLSNPFGSKDVYITQTYHSGSNNIAIDCYPNTYVANMPVYAVADGVIKLTNSKYGSYCILDVDDSKLEVFYVHTWNWLKKGTRVKKGQKICEIAPKSANGGNAEHLHIGLNIPYRIMNYFDRGIKFKVNASKYPNIAKEWFSNGNLKWSLFEDLYYNDGEIETNDRVEFTSSTNMRFGPGVSFKLAYLVSKGAVGRIADGPKTVVEGGVSRTWYDVYFIDCPEVSQYSHGWMYDGNMKKTTESITCVNGKQVVPPTGPSEPVDCSKYEKVIEQLQGEIEILEEDIREKEEKIQANEMKIGNLELMIKNYQIAHDDLMKYS